MESVEERITTLHRKREMSFTQKTYNKKIANGTSSRSLTDDEKAGEKLEERGIQIVDSEIRNFSNVSPSEVTNYYKGLGDWQNVLPKTDYAYSPISVYNKKKINGIYPIIPNMSRRRLWNNGYENVEISDRRTNEVHYQHHSYMSNRRLYHSLRNNREPTADVKSCSSSNTNLRQWISSKYSSVFQSSTELYQRWHSYFKKITASSAASSSSLSSSRKILVQYVFPFLFLLLISYFFLWSSFSPASSSPIDYVCKCSSIVYSYVSSVIESLFNLVHRIIDFTIASITFSLSCISGEFTLKSIANSMLVPFHPTFWSFVRSKPSADDTKTVDEKIHLDDAQIEELFRRFLDASSPELTRKITSSRDFVEAINRKLKDFEKERLHPYDELIHDHTVLSERLKSLELLVSESKTDELIKKLQEEIMILREEIQSKEMKIQNDFYTLLSLALPTESDEEVNFDNLRAKFVSIFRSIEEVHFKVDKLNQEFFNYVNNASERGEVVVERSKERVKFDLRTFIEELVAKKVEEWKKTTSSRVNLQGDVDVLEKYVKKIVQKALDVYDADKTGMTDYALESSGGIVLSTRCTETRKSHAQFSILGIPLWRTSMSPRTVIQPGVHPGECWAFPGSTGYLVIQLSNSIFITGVSLEHIPKAIAPNGTIDSAPKDFSVWALRSETDPEAKFLGKFRYDDDGPSVQSYDVIPLEQPYQIVELKILSNHGKIDYTCLYRFRVHGIPV